MTRALGDPRTSRRPGRGQTGFDFLVGMSVFLVALGLTLGFVPSMFQPFDTDTGPDMVTADRSASRLAEDLLATNVTEPGVLNETCTEEFFDADTNTGDCPFDADSSDVHGALAIDEFTDVNVTIESGGAIQSVDGVSLEVGDAPASTAEVVVAKRVVLLEDRQATLFVRVW